MNAGGILISFLQVCLTVAVIILVAFVILWVLTSVFGISIDGNVLKWGKIVVILLCLIPIVAWLLSLIGGGAGIGTHRFLFGRW